VLARWIDDNVAFPGSMVDRITPSTSLTDRDDVTARFGVADRWPVITEEFSQWVMEDEFCNSRPPLEQVGVQFVPDVGDHELMKTRLLNASHSAMGYLGSLAGLTRVDEFMADPVLSRYVAALMAEEIAPLLPCPDGVDLAAYQDSLLQRFADPAIGDRLDRLCRRGSSKVPLYLLPSLVAALEQGRPTRLLTLAVAGWCRYLQGVDLAGVSLAVADDRAEELGRLARAGGTDPRPLLSVRSVFGGLGDDTRVVAAVAGLLRRFDQHGIRATVRAVLDDQTGTRHDADGPASGRRSGDVPRRVLPTAGPTAGPAARVAAGGRLLPA
jgi:mannitol 2-dehydrogenase